MGNFILNYWWAGAIAIAVVVAYLLRTRKGSTGATGVRLNGSEVNDDGLFVFDPKANMLMAVGASFPGIKLPQDLAAAERTVVVSYLTVALRLGLTLSFANPGYGARISRELIALFEQKEREYADLGFQPLTPKAFTGLAGWNEPLPDDEPVCARVPQGSHPELYTALVRQYYAQYIDA